MGATRNLYNIWMMWPAKEEGRSKWELALAGESSGHQNPSKSQAEHLTHACVGSKQFASERTWRWLLLSVGCWTVFLDKLWVRKPERSYFGVQRGKPHGPRDYDRDL